MSEPTLRILSLGAGVQSTTLALMICDGDLPMVDGAIFADTMGEPQAVYDQVDRLEVEFAKVGIPLYRVQNMTVEEAAALGRALLAATDAATAADC